VKDQAFSWVSDVFLKMATPKNLVSISCQNSVLTNQVGFLHFALENFLDFLSKLVFRAQVWVIMEKSTNLAFGLGFERKWNIGVKK
jgi:hypothetical protein